MMKEALEEVLQKAKEEKIEPQTLSFVVSALDGPFMIGFLTKQLNEDIESGKVKNRQAALGEIDVYIGETLRRARAKANLLKSVTYASAVTKAMLIYAEEHNGLLPPADKWGSVSTQNLQTPRLLFSPQLPISDELRKELRDFKTNDPNRWELGCHYALNKAVAGKSLKEQGARVLIFESDLGWNGSGGLADAKKFMAKHKLTAIAVGFTDGTARQLTLKELKSLKW